MKSAVINGAVEGVTADGAKWLGNVIENRIKARRATKESGAFARKVKTASSKSSVVIEGAKNANGFDVPEIAINKKGELTTYINVYRTETGYVLGCPGNP